MENKPKLHVAMFPWLAYGHLSPFLEVSKFLAQKGHQIFFISTPKNIQKLPKIPQSMSTQIHLIELPLTHVNGLPEHAESTSELPIHKVPYLKKAYDKLQNPLIQFLKDHSDIHWIIHDFASHWLPQLANQFGINSVFFSIYSATTLAFGGSPSEMVNGYRKQPEDFTVVPKWIDYPSNVASKLFEVLIHEQCLDSDVPDQQRLADVIKDCNFVIVRTCPEFDSNSLSLIQKLYGKPVVPIGLLPPSEKDNEGNWDSIKEWLDRKTENSVFYIALGTEVSLTREWTTELANGIEKSGLPFIWVVKNRPLVEGMSGSDIIPTGFETRVSDRGLIIRDWVPQVKILSHKAIGGFLTHCGWSSVIEALGFGKALILFSGGGSDLGLVARLMHGNGLGLEIPRDDKDGSFTSEDVTESIRRVMVDKEGEPVRLKAREMKDVFGNVELQKKYLNEFTQFLESYSI